MFRILGFYKLKDNFKLYKSSSINIKGYKINRLFLVVYLIWLSIHTTFFLIATGTNREYDGGDYFFPFSDLVDYDMSELFVYSFAPILVYVIRSILKNAKVD